METDEKYRGRGRKREILKTFSCVVNIRLLIISKVISVNDFLYEKLDLLALFKENLKKIKNLEYTPVY